MKLEEMNRLMGLDSIDDSGNTYLDDHICDEIYFPDWPSLDSSTSNPKKTLKKKSNHIKRVTIRFTEEEYNKIRKHVKEYESMSDMVRQILLEKFGDDKNE